jgi:hypothetical protein
MFEVRNPANHAIHRVLRRLLFWIVLDVVALELDELIEAEPAQRLSFTRILPSDPRQILCWSASCVATSVVDLRVRGSRTD